MSKRSQAREAWPGRLDYKPLTEEALAALPLGTIRDFRVGEVYIKCEKREDG